MTHTPLTQIKHEANGEPHDRQTNNHTMSSSRCHLHHPVSNMSSDRQVLVVLWIFCLHFFPTTNSIRTKRELKFPKGGSFVAAVALASLLPKGPTDGLAHVLEFDLGFPFPEKLVFGQEEKKRRWKRSLKKEQRKNLLMKIEDIVNRIGYNGSSCTTRFQCELLTVTPGTSLLEDILLTLFKPSKLNDKQCSEHNETCPMSLLHILLHSEQITTPEWI